MKKMLEAGVHFGHRSRFWHPKMDKYIYGTRNGVHIINLEKTLPMFNDVLNFASKTAANGGSILFVGTKRAATNIMKEEAIRCGMPYVNHRWLGGMMTNYKTIKASIKRLKDLEFLAEDNFAQFAKKESLMMTREMEKLERSLGGIKDLGGIPDVVFVVDIGHEKNAIAESKKLNLPIIGIVDTNHNPEGIDYVVPGNDDSIRAIGYYAREIANAILEAKAASSTPQVKTATIKKKPVATKIDAPVANKKATETPTEAPAEVATEAPTKKSAEKPVKAPAKKPTAQPTKAVKSTKKPTATAKPEANLSTLLKADLISLAKEKGIEISPKDTKADIIAKLG